MTNYCDRCSRQCGDAYACTECAKTATTNLRHIADLAASLSEKRAKIRSSWDVTNLGASRPAKTWRVDTSEHTTFAASPTFTPGTALSFDPRVTRVRHRTTRGLVGIAAGVLDAHPEPVIAGPTCRGCTPEHESCRLIRRQPLALDDSPATIARWLINHVHWLRLQPDAGATFDRISRIVDDLHRLFDNPPPALFLGECKAEFEDGECTESLYLDREKVTSDTVDCPRCGITHDVAERRTVLMEGVAEYLGTAKEISRLLRNLAGSDVSERRIREYAAHGLLTRMGTRREFDREGRPRDVATYRIGDVREVAESVQRRRAERREQKSRREQRVG